MPKVTLKMTSPRDIGFRTEADIDIGDDEWVGLTRDQKDDYLVEIIEDFVWENIEVTWGEDEDGD